MRISNEEMIGKRFSRLVVEYQTEDHIMPCGARYARFHCKCDCGGECDARKFDLTSGRQTGCGCVRKERVQEKWKDEEFKKKMADAKRTPEARKAVSEGLKRSWLREDFREKRRGGVSQARKP